MAENSKHAETTAVKIGLEIWRVAANALARRAEV
jgi:hypothetical protein